MYLAMKWLIVLTVGMWVTLCCFDVVFKRMEVTRNKQDVMMTSVPAYDNNITSKPNRQSRYSRLLNRMQKLKKYNNSTSSLYYLNFFAGALVIIAYNKRAIIAQILSNIINALKLHVETLSLSISNKLSDESFRLSLNKTVARIWVAIQEYCRISWQIAVLLYYKIPKYEGKTKEHDDIKTLLLSKIKELGDERKNLGQLLMAAIQENKNIRLQYKLESMAKSRLVRHLDEIQKQSKSSRSKYVNLKQVYMITIEENAYLKARANKLRAERDEVVNNLMVLIKEVQKTPEGNLKALCGQIMSKGNIGGEGKSETCFRHSESLDATNPLGRGSTGSVTARSSVHDNVAVPYISDEPMPKLRGLPGEYMWTIKDKNGFIEKLYEYDYGYIYDNGDTIRRIREYTVYHDKDCLLDFSSSRTVLQELPAQNSIPQCETPSPMTSSQMHTSQGPVPQTTAGCFHTRHIAQECTSPIPGTSKMSTSNNHQNHMSTPGTSQMYNHKNRMSAGMSQAHVQNHHTVELGQRHMNYNMERTRRCQCSHEAQPPTASHRFLTGSVAFQTFLQNNKNIVAYAPRQRVAV